jgi:hypothetical protein
VVSVLKRKESVMNRLMIATIVGFSVVLLTQAQEHSYVIPIKDHTKIYANMQGRSNGVTEMFDVGLMDRLKVEDVAECCFKVIDSKGRAGWIEKTMCCKDPGTGRRFSFDALSVEGYLGNPMFFKVDGMRDLDDAGIRLDRSFRENLKDNIDKETIVRMSE